MTKKTAENDKEMKARAAEEDEAAKKAAEDEAAKKAASEDNGDDDDDDGDDDEKKKAAAKAKARIQAIIQSPHAKGREALAQCLAFNTKMSAPEAIAALEVAPAEAPAPAHAAGHKPEPKEEPHLSEFDRDYKAGRESAAKLLGKAAA